MKNLAYWIALSGIFLSFSFAEEITSLPEKSYHDPSSVTKHNMQINGVNIPYTATVGTIPIKNTQQKTKAEIFYVSYVKSDVSDASKRPLTFCFNGGPGSSCVWLHIGAFGPLRILCDDSGVPSYPFTLVDNNYSLLDQTDLVFVDPVSTGYSQVIGEEDPKQFHGVEKDIESIAEFIRMYLTKYDRWLSPKILLGESYGTTRVAGLSSHLMNTHFINTDGIVLVSSVLNWQTIQSRERLMGNDLACSLALPSFAATAYFYKKVDTSKKFSEFLKEVEDFASTDYTLALMKGDNLQQDKKEELSKKISYYTGLSYSYILENNLRFTTGNFMKELLKDELKITGRYDSRISGFELNINSGVSSYDPSFEMLARGYTATFNEYLSVNLKWKNEREYKIISNVHPWEYKKHGNTYLNLSLDISDVLVKNNRFKVFVASGYYDLATPYFATSYTLDHLQLPKDLKRNIISKFYHGGHMMYLNEENLKLMKKDLTDFYQQNLTGQ